MNKQEFLRELSGRLTRLPASEREKILAFYAELIDGSIEDGMLETEAIEKLGSMDDITQAIAAELPMKTLIKSRVAQKQQKVGMFVLLILASPIWLPLLVCAASILFAAVVVLWAIDIAVWAVFVSGAAAALACLIGMLLYPEASFRLMLIGGMLTGAGCAALLFPASLFITRRFAYTTAWLWNQIKKSLLKQRGYR